MVLVFPRKSNQGSLMRLTFRHLHPRERAASLPSLREKDAVKPPEEPLSKMMTAARAAGFRYRKRDHVVHAAPKPHKPRNRSGSAVSLTGSACQSRESLAGDSNSSSVQSINATGNSLTVPEGTALRKRSGSVPALKVVTLATAWNLKYEQVRALKMTWSRLCEPPRSHCRGIVNLVERVWEKIDHKDKMIKEIFYKAAFVDSMNERCGEARRSSNGRSISTLRDHTHFFVSLVSQTVAQLECDPNFIFEHIDKIGRRHAYLKQYGFRSSHWEKIGEYFIDIVVIQDCVRGFPEACRAWTILIAAMIDRLRAAPRRGSIPSVMNSPSTSTQDVSRSGSPQQMGGHFRIYGSGIIRTGSQEAREKESRRMSCARPTASPTPSPCMAMQSLEKALPKVDIRGSSPALA